MDKNYKKIIKIIGQFLALFLVIFIIIYLIVNYPSLKVRVSYKLSPKEIRIESVEKDIIKENNSVEITYNDTLIIPKIAVKVPIIWTKNESEAAEDLKLGVSHYPGSVMPGEIGNSVIIGHSSNYWWDKGNYNSIFANLSNLENNNDVFVYFGNKKLLYRVYEKQTLSPLKINAEIFSNKKEPILTLITCMPLGTNINRLLVKTRLID